MGDNIIQRRPVSFYIKRIFGILLLLSLSAVFFFSAISKIFSFEAFQWTFIDMGVKSTITASVIAHLFIGLEFLIAVFLLFHIYLRQVTYPATIVLLLLLTGYLSILVLKQGNNGNCGCFGDWLYMKPLTAIWKNLAMIAATALLYFIYPVKPYKHQEWIATVLGMAAFVIPFVLSPLDIGNQPDKVSEPIKLELLYQPNQVQPGVDLRKGKHIIAFMSLTCPHCRKAAYLLHIIKQNHPEIPIYFVLSGHPDNLKNFFDDTHSIAVPHMLFRNTSDFIELAGPGVPAIYWVNNSVIERKANYYQLDPQIMLQWLKEGH
jgi:hypothetical protein